MLRFDDGLGDYGICELCGGWGEFAPGPEFTLYGDGTVIVRHGLGLPPRAEGLVVHSHPFRIGHLDEEEVQALLSFAIGEGGLGNASAFYEESEDTDDPTYSTFTVRAGGLDKRVAIHGPNPFQVLRDHLLDIAQRRGIPTEVWVPDRYWGLLIEVSSWIEVGVLPDVPDSAIVPWPWAGVAPWVLGTATEPRSESERRVMSQAEASVLGLSDNGGVVQGIYLLGSNGETIYSFSLWPMLPDETS